MNIAMIKGLVKSTGSEVAMVMMDSAQESLELLKEWEGKTAPPRPENKYDPKTEAANFRAFEAGVMGSQSLAIESLVKKRSQ